MQAAEQGRGVATYGNGTKLLNGAAQKLEGAIKASGQLIDHSCVWLADRFKLEGGKWAD